MRYWLRSCILYWLIHRLCDPLWNGKSFDFIDFLGRTQNLNSLQVFFSVFVCNLLCNSVLIQYMHFFAERHSGFKLVETKGRIKSIGQQCWGASVQFVFQVFYWIVPNFDGFPSKTNTFVVSQPPFEESAWNLYKIKSEWLSNNSLSFILIKIYKKKKIIRQKNGR